MAPGSSTWRLVLIHQQKGRTQMSKGITSPIVAMYGSIPIPCPWSRHCLHSPTPSSIPDTRWECTMEISEFAVHIFESLQTVLLWVCTYSVDWNIETFPPQKFARFPYNCRYCWMRKRGQLAFVGKMCILDFAKIVRTLQVPVTVRREQSVKRERKN